MGDHRSSGGRAVPGRMVRAVRLSAMLVTGAFVVSTLPGVRSGVGFDENLDGWLQGGCYVLLALVAWTRPLTSGLDRLLWTTVALAMTLRALGFVLFLGVVRHLDPVPYPSVADAAWMLVPVVLLLALWLLAKAHSARLPVALLLDAVIGGLAAAALAVALLYGVLVDLTQPGTPTSVVTVNLAYPVSDVALLIVVVGVLTMTRWRPTPSTAVLCLGIAGSAAVDALFLYQVSVGTFRPASLISALSMIVTVLIVASAWVPGPTASRRESDGVAPGIVAPAVFALVCIGALVYASAAEVHLIAIGLAAAGLVVAIVRAVLTITMDRIESGRALGAKHEELLRFQSLVETSGDFIAIALTDGTVIYLNPAGRELVGLPLDADVRATSIVDYLTEEGIAASLEVEQPAVLAHGRWEGESTLRDMRGGDPIPVAISSYVMFHPNTGEPWALATVQRDITERLAAERSLQELADERQVLLGRLVQAQEDERSRIASDVHDDSVQALAAVDLRLGLLRRQLQDRAPELLDGVDGLRHTVEGATARLRHLLFDLESPARRGNLLAALEEAAAFVFDSDVAWTVRGDRAEQLSEPVRVTVYRIAKEAMVNARKHANARRVTVDLRCDDDVLVLTVADDGSGLDADAMRDRPGHLGLPGMRDRAAVAGGTLTLEPGPEGGAVLRLLVPMAAPR